MLRFILAFALALYLWPALRLPYARLVVGGANLTFEFFESSPKTQVTLLSIEKYQAERGGLPSSAKSTFIGMAVDTLLPFLPLTLAIPRLKWRNRLGMLTLGLGSIYVIQTILLLILFRHAMATVFLDSKLDEIRHLAPFSYAPGDVTLYTELVKPFWVNVGYHWTGLVVGLGLAAWLLARQKTKETYHAT